MSRKLKDLLSSNHPLFVYNMSELEKASGNAGIDLRLLADITEAVHEVMRKLGLDSTNTTGLELYRALETIRDDDNFLHPSSYLLIDLGDGPISLNRQDVIENAHHEIAYEDRICDHAQRNLRREIIKRYAEHDKTSNDIVHELTNKAGIMREEDTHHAPIQLDSDAPFIFAVGDIFTDAFIELDPDEAVSFKDENDATHLMMQFGTKPPYLDSQVVNSVGPSPNAAVCFARLGAKVGLRAFLGDDQTGKESIEYLRSEHIDTSAVSLQSGIKSNYYYVLRLGADRTILVKNEQYEYTWQDPSEVPDWIYLSLLSEDSWQLHEDLLTYLNSHADTKLAFQPGTFHFKWGIEKLKDIYARSYIVVMNREEAVDVTGRSYDDLKALCDGLHQLGPEVVVITDGPEGSYASYGGKMLKIPNYPDPAPPLDRTGAGDAFAGTIVAALALGESLETALLWAPINSMSVVQKLGAQAGLVKREELDAYINEAPEWYKAEEYNG